MLTIPHPTVAADGPHDPVLLHYLQSEVRRAPAMFPEISAERRFSQGEIYPNISVPSANSPNIDRVIPVKSATLSGLGGVTQTWFEWFQQLISTDSSEEYPYRAKNFGGDGAEANFAPKPSDGIFGYLKASIYDISYALRLRKVFLAAYCVDVLAPDVAVLQRSLYSKIPHSLRHPMESQANCFAWHKYKSKLAVALKNDSVHIFDLTSRSTRLRLP